MSCFEKLSWNTRHRAEEKAETAGWIDISGLGPADRAWLWKHLVANHPGMAQLLGNAEQTGFAAVGGAEIWIERRYLPLALAIR